MKVSIKLLKTVQPMLSGFRDTDWYRALITTIKTGMAIKERTTKICQSGKSALIRLIRASPRDNAKTVKTMAKIASFRLSPSEWVCCFTVLARRQETH